MYSLRRIFAPALALTLVMAPVAHAAGNFYDQHNLVSDGFISADHTDPNLVNAWGLVFNPTGPAWVANNGTGTSTLYDGDGNAVPLVVKIPGPAGSATGSPTGIVFNGSEAFVVSSGNLNGPSRFIFATEDGTIAAWAPNVNATNAITVIDNSSNNAVYKGLALSAGGNGNLLYATDFHNAKIDVFDSTFKPVSVSGKFSDPTIPQGFAPFGIQAINGDIYVTYAKQNDAKHDDVKGKGFGFVNVFDPNGNLLRRVASEGALNSPWGLTVAPAGFGKLGGRLLVGNFGDGRINAYDLATGQFVGRLRGKDHTPLVIDGLWSLQFGNGFAAQPVDTLFFTSGPGDEQHGLYGRLAVIPGDTTNVGTESENSDN